MFEFQFSSVATNDAVNGLDIIKIEFDTVVEPTEQDKFGSTAAIVATGFTLLRAADAVSDSFTTTATLVAGSLKYSTITLDQNDPDSVSTSADFVLSASTLQQADNLLGVDSIASSAEIIDGSLTWA